MTTCLVTGVAGFVGSHLCERLIGQGHTVVGVDAFIPYYPRRLKERNLAGLNRQSDFRFHETDLRTDELSPLLDGVEVVFHLAAMAGLLRSWSEFESYMTCNVLATQRLLAAVAESPVRHLLHISTSSVYGTVATGDEESRLAPVSPYGITKLAAEHLCQAYAQNYGVPATILRLFSVYGPRQRPDMGYNIFIRAILQDEPITIFGDGNDSRTNTYIDDCVSGILRAFVLPERSIGQVFNLGGGDEVSVNQVLDILQELAGKPARIKHGPARPGDQRRTHANIEKAQRLLDYRPATKIVDGLAAQLKWQQSS